MINKLIISILLVPMLLVGAEETYHTKLFWTVLDVAQAIKEDLVEMDTYESTIAVFNGATPLRNWKHQEHVYLVTVLCNLLGASEKESTEYLDIVDYIHDSLTKDLKELPHVSKNTEVILPTVCGAPYEIKIFHELRIPYEKSRMRVHDLITTLYLRHHTNRALNNRKKNNRKLPLLINIPTYIAISPTMNDISSTANYSSIDSFFDDESINGTLPTNDKI